MPLRALVAGREVIAPELSTAEWEALQAEVAAGAAVILPCCGGAGYLRRSKFGTAHFAHKRGADCDASGETIQHLKAKADIVIACRRAGFSALTEVVGGSDADWRADVLATRGSRRIAFEVQWSFLRLKEAVFRQERYARDGVRGCWFFRKPPPNWRARRDLPLFQLLGNADGSFAVSINGRLHDLGEAVTALLSGDIRFCATAIARNEQTLDLIPFTIECPDCGRSTPVYRIDPLLTAGCGRTFQSHPLEFRREVLAAVRALRRQQPDLRFGAFAEQISTTGKKTLAFTCIHCGTPIPPERIDQALYGTNRLQTAERYPLAIKFARPISGREPHWCFPEDGEFCCEG